MQNIKKKAPEAFRNVHNTCFDSAHITKGTKMNVPKPTGLWADLPLKAKCERQENVMINLKNMTVVAATSMNYFVLGTYIS